MKLVSQIVGALFVCSTAYAAPEGEGIVGAFELKLGKPGNSVEMVLECATETACTFTTISQSGKSQFKDVQTLKTVRPVENLTYATNALKYAIGQQSRPIRNEEFAESMNRLRSVLSANPNISKCWDLNYPSPQYMLACTFSNPTPDAPPIYLFGTLMANCGEAFCRYIINPMSRSVPELSR